MNDMQSKSDEELNVMLAECLGYSECRIVIIGEFEQAIGYPTKNALGYEVLRFTSSLDAVATVEAGLDEATYCNTYLSCLARVCGFQPHDTFEEHKWSDLHSGRRAVVSAKPRQRTIALIATLQPKEPHE